MKKHIFSVLMAAMAAFTFSSCEDVPEPYTQPERPEQGETTTGEPKGTGTAEDPYNCAAAIQYCQSLDGAESTNDVYVKGKVQSIEEQFSSNYGNVSVTLVDEDGSTTFKIWRAYYFDNKKWTTGGKEVTIGDELVFCGKVVNYSGNTPETVQGKAWLVSINGENGSGSTTPDTPATGKGSESDPYTVTEAIEAIKASAPTTEVYLTGIISEVSYYNEKYKSITYYISDTGKSNDMQVYSGKGLNGADFTSKDDLKAGQKVTIKGIIKKFTDKNGNDIMEVDKTSSIVKIEDGGGSVTPEPTPSGDNMNLTSLINGKVSSEDLPENSYESQAAATESTWYSWKFDNITYKGARICKATTSGDFGGCIQVQGDASKVEKQGFLFNSTAFSKDIKSVTIVVRGAAKYDTPTTFTVYGGSTAHPTSSKIKGTYTTEKGESVNTFTMTYDFSAGSNKYFTIWNNAIGALYIEKIIVTLK